jgi:hypothetical protein
MKLNEFMDLIKKTEEESGISFNEFSEEEQISIFRLTSGLDEVLKSICENPDFLMDISKIDVFTYKNINPQGSSGIEKIKEIKKKDEKENDFKHNE